MSAPQKQKLLTKKMTTPLSEIHQNFEAARSVLISFRKRYADLQPSVWSQCCWQAVRLGTNSFTSRKLLAPMVQSTFSIIRFEQEVSR